MRNYIAASYVQYIKWSKEGVYEKEIESVYLFAFDDGTGYGMF